jgi:predicted DNA-binding ribbon-helix-helix protein
LNSNEINDGREEIAIELTDDEFLRLAKIAHERDITFNQLVEHILSEQIKRIEAEKAMDGYEQDLG